MKIENQPANEFVGIIIGSACNEKALDSGFGCSGEFGGSVTVAVAESGRGIIVEIESSFHYVIRYDNKSDKQVYMLIRGKVMVLYYKVNVEKRFWMLKPKNMERKAVMAPVGFGADTFKN